MKQLYTLAAALAVCTAAQATTTVIMKGKEINVDTIFHAKVGPGTTQTQLRLTGDGLLDVFYLTVDMTTPGVSLRTVSGRDKVAGSQTVRAMAEGRQSANTSFFAGVNGDFYWTSGTATNGTSEVGTPTAACTVDGEVYKTSNSNYQFSVDAEGIMRICTLDYYQGTATCGDATAPFKGINVGSPSNGITLYTPRYWGSTNQNAYAGNSYEVTARLVDGDKFTAGGTYRLQVTSEPNTTGDTTIPDDGFVIFGRGTAKDFVGALHTGDIVTMDNVTLTPGGERIYPQCVISGNPKNVGGGEVLDTEGERGDASARHPRTGIGYSADGQKVVMMVIDGRTASSVGVTTSFLGAVMRYAGADEGVNLDGGGSSTLYTRALGVRNHCSDGNERAVGNAIFAALDAPADDMEVAEIQFRDHAPALPYYGLYTPVVYAYNKYGVMVSDNYTDYTLSAPEAMGTVSADGRSICTGAVKDMYALTATAPGGIKTTVAVTVGGNVPAQPVYDQVLISDSRDWEIPLHALVGRDYVPVTPGAYKWVSSDAGVVTVDDSGVLHATGAGAATVTGSLQGVDDISVGVTVHPHTQASLPLQSPVVADTWAVSKTSVKDVVVTPLANEGGMALDYTVSGARGAKVTLSNTIPLYGHPLGFVVDCDPGTANFTDLALNLRANNAVYGVTPTLEKVTAGQPAHWYIDFADLFDTSDLGIYPISFVSLRLSPTDAVKTQCHIQFPTLRAVYTPDGSSVDAIGAKAGALTLNGGNVSLGSVCKSVRVYDARGILTAAVTHSDTVDLPDTPGLYLIVTEKGAFKVLRK